VNYQITVGEKIAYRVTLGAQSSLPLRQGEKIGITSSDNSVARATSDVTPAKDSVASGTITGVKNGKSVAISAQVIGDLPPRATSLALDVVDKPDPASRLGPYSVSPPGYGLVLAFGAADPQPTPAPAIINEPKE
jgi:hypothetical protein